jgi:hypothetical protein
MTNYLTHQRIKIPNIKNISPCPPASRFSSSYLNIQKIFTDEFLRSKGNYEIQKLQFKKVVRPIISKTPNEDGVWI